MRRLFSLPMPDWTDRDVGGQENSGLYLMGRYEVQILDSYDNKTYFDGQCASIYKQSPPIVNASPGWRARPRFRRTRLHASGSRRGH